MHKRKVQATEMFLEKLNGKDNREIATIHGVTAERVRQLINKHVRQSMETLLSLGLEDHAKFLEFCLVSILSGKAIAWPYHKWAADIHTLTITSRGRECRKFIVPSCMSGVVVSH